MRSPRALLACLLLLLLLVCWWEIFEKRTSFFLFLSPFFLGSTHICMHACMHLVVVISWFSLALHSASGFESACGPPNLEDEIFLRFGRNELIVPELLSHERIRCRHAINADL